MLKLLFALAVGTAVTMAGPATAQQHNHPDLVGTWNGEIDAVSITGGGDAKPVFGTFSATLVITEEQGERFAGTFALEGDESHAIVGVFTEPGRILWSEPDGFAHGKVIDNEVIEVCFVRSTPTDQIASCERYNRKE